MVDRKLSIPSPGRPPHAATALSSSQSPSVRGRLLAARMPRPRRPCITSPATPAPPLISNYAALLTVPSGTAIPVCFMS